LASFEDGKIGEIPNFLLLKSNFQQSGNIFCSGSASSSKSATIEMYVGSSYNETLSGETLSSMSEKSDSYFTTELDSRHRPGGGSRYLAEHSPVYGPADFQDEPDDEHRPLPSSHAFPPSWGHCTLPRPQPGQHVGRQQRQHHGLSRQHSTSNLGDSNTLSFSEIFFAERLKLKFPFL